MRSGRSWCEWGRAAAHGRPCAHPVQESPCGPCPPLACNNLLCRLPTFFFPLATPIPGYAAADRLYVLLPPSRLGYYLREHRADGIAQDELVTIPGHLQDRRPIRSMMRVDSGTPPHKLPRRRHYLFGTYSYMFPFCSCPLEGDLFPALCNCR